MIDPLISPWFSSTQTITVYQGNPIHIGWVVGGKTTWKPPFWYVLIWWISILAKDGLKCLTHMEPPDIQHGTSQIEAPSNRWSYMVLGEWSNPQLNQSDSLWSWDLGQCLLYCIYYVYIYICYVYIYIYILCIYYLVGGLEHEWIIFHSLGNVIIPTDEHVFSEA